MTEVEHNWHGHHRLPDGREMHWVEFGDPGGTPALWCHGTPGSGWEAVLAARAARRRHVRLISASRPGMGRSDDERDATIMDWTHDVAALADHLRLGRFSVVGFSGGAPFALACALAFPERLARVALVAPAGPPVPHTPRWLLEALGLAAAVTTRRPWLLRPVMALNPNLRGTTPGQRAALTRSVSEGATPAGREEMLLHEYGTWGFDPQQITFPGIHVWQGLKDRSVLPDETRALVADLPGAVLHEYPRDGHHSLAVRRADEVMRWVAL